MTGPLHRLINELDYPFLAGEELAAFVTGPGARVLFLSGDPATNLETNDVAAILPELVKAFPGRFKPAVVDRAEEDATRERFQVWPVPSLLFFQDGRMTGVISKVRDWDDYLGEIHAILQGTSVSANIIARDGSVRT